jgi:hypothetical protein
MFTVAPHPRPSSNRRTGGKEFSFVKNPERPLGHVRTTFTVTPHPAKITQENGRKGVSLLKTGITPFLPSSCLLLEWNAV